MIIPAVFGVLLSTAFSQPLCGVDTGGRRLFFIEVKRLCEVGQLTAMPGMQESVGTD